jgi:hypothetical protein
MTVVTDADRIADLTEKFRVQIQGIQELTGDNPSNEVIRALLPLVGATLDALQDLEQQVFSWRLNLWLAGRRNTPPIPNPELGRLCGVTDVNVMKQLRKYRDTNPND